MVQLPDCRAFRPGKAFNAGRGPQAASNCYYGNGKDAQAIANQWGKESVGSPVGRQGSLKSFCFQTLAPSMDWLEFLSFLLSPLELGDSEPVVVYGTEYLQQVSELINRTEPRYDWGMGVVCVCGRGGGTG